MPVLPPSTDRVDLILQFFCLLRGGSNLIHVKSDAAAAPARYNNAQPLQGMRVVGEVLWILYTQLCYSF
ncbi:hypothetical protein OUZ56_002653 [Daphnia magna]|uniref:Uncharacterized protein n=1 Tax=Daphnia magna TaxID=35525 RepID=A0ABR0A6G3_9CRUS|nr:hypothetical protein OUZ56_002653 [Daphnia magna]